MLRSLKTIVPKQTLSSKAPAQFQALNQVQRAPNPQVFFEQSKVFLQQALANDLQDRNALQAAYHHLNRALHGDPQNLEYMQIKAFILVLIGLPKRAEIYIEKVLGHDPNHREALVLKHHLHSSRNTSGRRKQAWKKLESIPLPLKESQWDDYYDEIEDFIQSEVRYMMRSTIPYDLSLNTELFLNQEKRYDQLVALQKLLKPKLDYLHKNMDIQALEGQLKPLQQIQARLERALETYCQFYLIFDRMTTGLGHVEAFESDLKAGKTFAQQDDLINAIYDLCDAVADQLDTLAKQVDIYDLEQVYNELVMRVERLQDLMDDV